MARLQLLTARRDWAQGRREADAALFEVIMGFPAVVQDL
jgi:hypothetical protein